jgi:hypothetical protein
MEDEQQFPLEPNFPREKAPVETDPQISLNQRDRNKGIETHAEKVDRVADEVLKALAAYYENNPISSDSTNTAREVEEDLRKALRTGSDSFISNTRDNNGDTTGHEWPSKENAYKYAEVINAYGENIITATVTTERSPGKEISPHRIDVRILTEDAKQAQELRRQAAESERKAEEARQRAKANLKPEIIRPEVTAQLDRLHNARSVAQVKAALSALQRLDYMFQLNKDHLRVSISPDTIWGDVTRAEVYAETGTSDQLNAALDKIPDLPGTKQTIINELTTTFRCVDTIRQPDCTIDEMLESLKELKEFGFAFHGQKDGKPVERTAQEIEQAISNVLSHPNEKIWLLRVTSLLDIRDKLEEQLAAQKKPGLLRSLQFWKK